MIRNQRPAVARRGGVCKTELSLSRNRFRSVLFLKMFRRSTPLHMIWCKAPGASILAWRGIWLHSHKQLKKKRLISTLSSFVHNHIFPRPNPAVDSDPINSPYLFDLEHHRRYLNVLNGTKKFWTILIYLYNLMVLDIIGGDSWTRTKR